MSTMSSISSMKLKKSLMDGMVKMNIELCKGAVLECSKMYNFDGEEAIRRMFQDVDVVEKVVKEKVVKEKVVKEKVVKEKVVKDKKSEFPMPFNNKKNEDCCSGIRLNHGLYTQCENKKGNDKYCKSCDKQSKKNEDGKPDYGDIDDRLNVGLYEFRDRKGKSPTEYLKVLKKLNINIEDVLKEAEGKNRVIEEEHLKSIEETKRGRPKTDKKVKESSGKKGRPKKESKVVDVNSSSSSSEQEDLFASLVSNAVAVASGNSVEVSSVNDDNEEVDVVTKFEHEGKMYLKSKKSGILYNMDDQEMIGKWDDTTKSIEYIEEGELYDDEIDEDDE